MRVYGIYAWVVDVSEIEWVSTENEWGFWYENKKCAYTRTKHFPCGIVFIMYILRHSSFWKSFFFNLSKMLKFATTYCEMTNKMKHLSLPLILFSLLCFLLPCCLASSLQFSSSTENTLNYSLPISEVFVTFLQEKLFKKNFSCYMSAKHSQSKGTASCKCLRQELWYETHTPLWLLIARIIFLTHEKTLFTILIRRIIFFTCEKHCLLLWLVRTHLHMNIPS